MTCTCGSTIKKEGFWPHFYTEEHLKYLIPVLIREAKEKDAQREEEWRLQRLAAQAARAQAARAQAQAARAQAEATARPATSTSERDPFDAEEACSEDDEDEQASSENEL